MTKQERIWKKKLFRYLGIKNKTKQKERNKEIITTKAYKKGGYKRFLSCCKASDDSMRRILEAAAKAGRDIGKAMIALSESTKLATSSLESLHSVLKSMPDL